MRRNNNTIKLMIAMMLLVSMLFSVTSFAEETEYDESALYETAMDLYESWYQNFDGNGFPYPEYVTDVVSTDGYSPALTFYMLQGSGDAEKQEILSQIKDKSTVSFKEGGDTPINKLYKIQESLISSMNEENGVYTLGVDEIENRLTVGINMQAPNAQNFVESLKSQYGDKVFFREMDAPIFTDEEISEMVAEEIAKQETEKGSNKMPTVARIVWIACGGVGLLFAIFITVVLMVKKKKK